MRNPQISCVFVSSIACDEKGFPLCCWALDWAIDHLSHKRLLNHENSWKGFRMGIIETCDADRRCDHFHSILEKSMNNFSENFSRVPSRNDRDLRCSDIPCESRTLTWRSSFSRKYWAQTVTANTSVHILMSCDPRFASRRQSMRAKPWVLCLLSFYPGFKHLFWELSSLFLTESFLLA